MVLQQHRLHYGTAAWAIGVVLLLRIVVTTTTDATNVPDNNGDSSIASLDFGPCRITALLPFR
jgi:hypothetical protein